MYPYELLISLSADKTRPDSEFSPFAVLDTIQERTRDCLQMVALDPYKDRIRE
jgi:hypothetical protein